MSTATVNDMVDSVDAAAEPRDDSPAPTPPARPSRVRRALRVLRTAVMVLALVAAAVIGGSYVVERRVAAQAFVDAGTAVLTAEPVPVGSADAGVVRQLLVADQDSVTAGAPVARIALPAEGPDYAPRVQVLRAPTAGIVTGIDVAVGEVARPGEPVVTLYDPTKLAFLVDVPLDALRRMRLGMTATISGPGLSSPVTATLDKVVPKVDPADPARVSDRLTVIFKPAAAQQATVRTLVPGLQFDVVVDTNTATGSTPAVNSA